MDISVLRIDLKEFPTGIVSNILLDIEELIEIDTAKVLNDDDVIILLNRTEEISYSNIFNLSN